MKKCILLSGGIDSIALAYWKRPQLAITVDYGQASAAAEIEAATQSANAIGFEHTVIRVDCSAIGAGNMVQGKSNSKLLISPSPEWWPYRNQLIITLAATKAVQFGINVLILGTVKSDGLHRDGRKGFISKLNSVLSYQEGNLQLDAPAATLTSIELVKKSKVPKEILLWAHSCHQGCIPCGECRGCINYREVINTAMNYAS